MNKKNLFLVAALIWGIPGVIVSAKGIRAYLSMAQEDHWWWLLFFTAGVIAGFYTIFSRIVDKYSNRIASLPQRTSILQTFPLRGWILVICMSSLGIAMKFIPVIPEAFTASFYSGLGPMLILAALRFIRNKENIE